VASAKREEDRRAAEQSYLETPILSVFLSFSFFYKEKKN
jgi:hypothetical protein